MRKLNRKGFTLVELLAVIVILAIVVGIAIPGVTSVINNSKNKAMGVAVETAVDYLSDQYDLYIIGQSESTAFKELLNSTNVELTTTQLEELGFKSKNVTTVEVTLKETSGKANICVRITKVPTSSDYFTTQYFDSDGNIKTGVDGTQNYAGNACGA